MIRSSPAVSRGPEGTVVGFPAEVDVRNAFMIRDRLPRLHNEGADPLILDLTSARFCDCAGIRAITRAHRRACGLHTDIHVVIPPAGPVRRIATLTGLHLRVPVSESVRAAHEAMRRPPIRSLRR